MTRSDSDGRSSSTVEGDLHEDEMFLLHHSRTAITTNTNTNPTTLESSRDEERGLQFLIPDEDDPFLSTSIAASDPPSPLYKMRKKIVICLYTLAFTYLLFLVVIQQEDDDIFRNFGGGGSRSKNALTSIITLSLPQNQNPKYDNNGTPSSWKKEDSQLEGVGTNPNSTDGTITTTTTGTQTTIQTFESMPAGFGLSLVGSIEAHLVYFPQDEMVCPHDNDNGDPSSSSDTEDVKVISFKPPSDGKPVALLASRGNCAFESKATEALHNIPSLLYKGVPYPISYLIVYDNVPSHSGANSGKENLIQMGADRYEMNYIPLTLFFVSHETGMILRQTIQDYAAAASNNSPSSSSSDEDQSSPSITDGIMITLSSSTSSSDTTTTTSPSITKHHDKGKRHQDKQDDDIYHYDDDYYGRKNTTTSVIFAQMIMAMAFIYFLFFFAGFCLVCFCGEDNGDANDGANDDGNQPGGRRMSRTGWFTIHLDRSGIRFMRRHGNNGDDSDEDDNDDNGGVREMRLLTEDEVLAFPEVAYVSVKEVSDDEEEEEKSLRKVEDVESGSSGLGRGDEAQLTTESSTGIVEGAEHSDTDDEKDEKITHSLLPWLKEGEPYFRYTAINSLCSICLEEYEEGELVRVLPCGHMFHTECIVPWLTERFPNCPLCKAGIQVVREDEDEGDDDELEESREDYTGEDNSGEDNDGGDISDDHSDEEETDTNEPLLSTFFSLWRRRGRRRRRRIAMDNDEEVGQEQSQEETDRLSNLRTPLLRDGRSPSPQYARSNSM